MLFVMIKYNTNVILETSFSSPSQSICYGSESHHL